MTRQEWHGQDPALAVPGGGRRGPADPGSPSWRPKPRGRGRGRRGTLSVIRLSSSGRPAPGHRPVMRSPPPSAHPYDPSRTQKRPTPSLAKPHPPLASTAQGQRTAQARGGPGVRRSRERSGAAGSRAAGPAGVGSSGAARGARRAARQQQRRGARNTRARDAARDGGAGGLVAGAAAAGAFVLRCGGGRRGVRAAPAARGPLAAAAACPARGTPRRRAPPPPLRAPAASPANGPSPLRSQWFDAIDKDRNGKLTAMELQSALQLGGLNFSLATVAHIIR
jgi:hypothetical protein